MKKIIFALVLMFGFMLPTALSINATNSTSTDMRILVDITHYYSNSSLPAFIGNVRNLDGSPMYLVFRAVPMPNSTCYYENQNCPMGSWSTNLKVSVLYFSGAEEPTQYLDMSQCWNWWNTTDSSLRDLRAGDCPTMTLHFSWKGIFSFAVEDGVLLIGENPSGGTFTDFQFELLGYQQSSFNSDNRMSPKVKSLVDTTASLTDTVTNVWEIIFYMAIAVILILGIGTLLMFPISIKWVIEKVME